jgi:hypothetical protein
LNSRCATENQIPHEESEIQLFYQEEKIKSVVSLIIDAGTVSYEVYDRIASYYTETLRERMHQVIG